MKIVHVQPALPRYRIDFFDRLARRYQGDLVVYYSPSGLGILTDQKVSKAWAIKAGPTFRLFPGVFWQRNVAWLPFWPGDILVLSGNPRYLSNLVLLLRARFLGAKIVWWGHLKSSTSKMWRYVIRRSIMRFADAYLFYTDEEAEAWRREAISLADKPVGALNNGLDLTEIAKFRENYDPKKRQCRLLFIGRFTNKAEIDLALEALSLSNRRDICIDFIGDGELSEELKGKARQLGLSDRVVWHGPLVNEQKIAEIANLCRGFLYPGQVGLSLLHAMSYGLPAIVHSRRDRHMPEIAAFEDGVTGRSFNFGEAMDLSTVMEEFVENEQFLRSASSLSLERVAEKFSTEKMAARFENLIFDLSDSP